MKQKLSAFMYGRYGSDKLNWFLIILYFVMTLLSVFIPNLIVKILVNVISLLLFLLVFYRMFSRNIPKRTAENNTYLKITRGIREWFLLQKNKWKYRKTHIYRTCPSCKATIRLKKLSGEHLCTCPRCHTEFRVKTK